MPVGAARGGAPGRVASPACSTLSRPRSTPRSSKSGNPEPGGSRDYAATVANPNMQKMLQQVQKMQEDLAATQASLADETVEITAGGGTITVVATGAQEIRSVSIDAAAVDPDDVEMLQDIVVAGVNEALRASRELAESKLATVTGGLDMGSLGGLLG